jgi:hypothetical protein
LSRVAATWQYTIPQGSGVLYTSTFDQFADEWEPAAGRLSAQMIDSVMRLEIGAPDSSVFTPLRWSMRDFDLTVRATATQGSDNNGFGVVFRQQDSRNLYYFAVSSDGYYQLALVQNGVTTEISTWQRSEYINLGLNAENRLRVSGQGADFRFWINDQPALLCVPIDPNAVSTAPAGICQPETMRLTETITDDRLIEGRLGLIALSFNTTNEFGIYENVIVDFDDLIVSHPD